MSAILIENKKAVRKKAANMVEKMQAAMMIAGCSSKKGAIYGVNEAIGACHGFFEPAIINAALEYCEEKSKKL